MFYIPMQFYSSTDQERLAVLLFKAVLSVEGFDIFCVGTFPTYLRGNGYLKTDIQQLFSLQCGQKLHVVTSKKCVLFWGELSLLMAF